MRHLRIISNNIQNQYKTFHISSNHSMKVYIYTHDFAYFCMLWCICIWIWNCSLFKNNSMFKFKKWKILFQQPIKMSLLKTKQEVINVDKSRHNHRRKWWNIIVHWKKREREMKVLCLLLNNTLTIQGQRGINCENERIIGGVKTITKNLKRYFKTRLLAVITFIKNICFARYVFLNYISILAFVYSKVNFNLDLPHSALLMNYNIHV